MYQQTALSVLSALITVGDLFKEHPRETIRKYFQSKTYSWMHPFLIGMTPFWDVIKQGAVDAANMTGVIVDWLSPQASGFDENFMAEQIRNAVNSQQYDGMFVSIPTSGIAEAVGAVRKNPGFTASTRFPIVVMNAGMQTAKQMGLLSVLQDEIASGEMIGNALLDKGKSYFTLTGILIHCR